LLKTAKFIVATIQQSEFCKSSIYMNSHFLDRGEANRPYAILWDIAYGDKNSLTWCCGNSSKGPQPVPVPVEGNFAEPFMLVSVKQNGKYLLKAVSVNDNRYDIPVICMFDQKFLDECRSEVKFGLKNIFHWNATGTFDTHFKEEPGDFVDEEEDTMETLA